MDKPYVDRLLEKQRRDDEVYWAKRAAEPGLWGRDDEAYWNHENRVRFPTKKQRREIEEAYDRLFPDTAVIEKTSPERLIDAPFRSDMPQGNGALPFVNDGKRFHHESVITAETGLPSAADDPTLFSKGEDRARGHCAEDIASRAAMLVGGDRNRQHGAKEDNFQRIANMWNAWLKTRKDSAADLSAHDVGILMVLMKLARTQSGSLNIDDYIDACGYAACAGEVAQISA